MLHSIQYKRIIFWKIRFLCGIFAFIIYCGASATALAAESEDLEERFKNLSNQLRCPTCQGLSVKDSEAGFSTSIKNKIRELIEQGKSDKEIIEYFVHRYGEWILRSPPKTGFNLILWILPGAAILIGLLWVMYRSKNWVKKPIEELAQLTPEEEQKVMDDLSRFEKS